MVRAQRGSSRRQQARSTIATLVSPGSPTPILPKCLDPDVIAEAQKKATEKLEAERLVS